MAKSSNRVIALGTVLVRNIKASPQVVPKKVSTEPKWKPVKLALLIRLEARTGKEKELGDFLRSCLTSVQQAPTTAAWFAIRSSKSTFAVFLRVYRGKGPPGESNRRAGDAAKRANARTAGQASGGRKN